MKYDRSGRLIEQPLGKELFAMWFAFAFMAATVILGGLYTPHWSI